MPIKKRDGQTETCLDTPLPKIYKNIPLMQDNWRDHIEKMPYGYENIDIIRVEKIMSILIENDELREEMYQKTNQEQQRLAILFSDLTDISTSQFNANTDSLASRFSLGKGVPYQLVYKIMSSLLYLNLSNRQPGESKIRKVWRLGLLPFAAIILHTLEVFIMVCRKSNPKAMDSVLASVTQSLAPKLKKINSSTAKVSISYSNDILALDNHKKNDYLYSKRGEN